MTEFIINSIYLKANGCLIALQQFFDMVKVLIFLIAIHETETAQNEGPCSSSLIGSLTVNISSYPTSRDFAHVNSRSKEPFQQQCIVS